MGTVEEWESQVCVSEAWVPHLITGAVGSAEGKGRGGASGAAPEGPRYHKSISPKHPWVSRQHLPDPAENSQLQEDAYFELLWAQDRPDRLCQSSGLQW